MSKETSSRALATDNKQVTTDAPGACRRRFRAKARRWPPRVRALQKRGTGMTLNRSKTHRFTACPRLKMVSNWCLVRTQLDTNLQG